MEDFVIDMVMPEWGISGYPSMLLHLSEQPPSSKVSVLHSKIGLYTNFTSKNTTIKINNRLSQDISKFIKFIQILHFWQIFPICVLQYLEKFIIWSSKSEISSYPKSNKMSHNCLWITQHDHSLLNDVRSMMVVWLHYIANISRSSDKPPDHLGSKQSQFNSVFTNNPSKRISSHCCTSWDT